MGKERRKSLRLRTAAQLRLAQSPVVIDIIQVLRQKGPATVREIGQMLGRNPNPLHYHIRKIAAAGLIQEVDTRRSGARTESIYDVVANEFVGTSAPRSSKLRELTCRAVSALLRLADRNFASAAARPDEVTEKGRYCDLNAARYSGRLTKSQLAEVNHHLSAIQAIYKKNIGSRRGRLSALTFVITPLDDTSIQQQQE